MNNSHNYPPKAEIPKVLYVHDPLSDKHYNLMPMFYYLNENWYCKDGPTDMARRIQEVLDYMCTTVMVNERKPMHFDLQKINDLNMILIHLRKAFEDMNNV